MSLASGSSEGTSAENKKSNFSGAKSELIKKYRRNEADTGSPEVQIALLTSRLEVLGKHFGKNPKDHHSQRGMLKLISQRKSLLQYLKDEDINRYRTTISALGLRK